MWARFPVGLRGAAGKDRKTENNLLRGCRRILWLPRDRGAQSGALEGRVGTTEVVSLESVGDLRWSPLTLPSLPLSPKWPFRSLLQNAARRCVWGEGEEDREDGPFPVGVCKGLA